VFIAHIKCVFHDCFILSDLYRNLLKALEVTLIMFT
jgi:hypothetical protein